MRVLTLNAVLHCAHVNGIVGLEPSQVWVTVTEPQAGDRRARTAAPWLVHPDPEDRPIRGCPNINVGIFPCTITKPVGTGYSNFVRIGGHPVCLDTVKGLTNGSPGIFDYSVATAGQNFVECRS